MLRHGAKLCASFKYTGLLRHAMQVREALAMHLMGKVSVLYGQQADSRWAYPQMTPS